MPYNPNAIWDSKKPKPLASDVVSTQITGTPASPSEKFGPSGSGRHAGFLWVGIGVLIFGLGGFLFYHFLMPQALPSAAVVVAAPDKVFIGDPFAVSIAVQNTSGVILKNVKLDFDLPAGVSVVGVKQGQTPVSFSIGDIATGTTITQTSTLIATDGLGSVVSLAVRAEYGGNPGPQVQLQANGSANMTVGDPAIRLSVAAPASAVAGSPIAVAVTYVNDSPDVLSDVRIALGAPPAFVLGTGAGTVASGTVWDVGLIAPRATGTIAVYGDLMSDAEAIYSFGASFIIATSGEQYVIAGPTANVALHQPPLSLVISANGSSSYTTAPNDFLIYTIHYANHASVALQGVMVRAKLTGSMFDFSTVGSNGSFDSRTNTVTWSTSAVPAFVSIAPGASGDLALRVKVLRDFPIHRASDKNFSLRVDGEIVSGTVLPGVVATSTASVASLTTKIAGNVAVASRGYRYDDASGIINTGPYPPVVNQETKYTIHWTVTDSADDLRDVVLSAALPTGVTFTGKVTSNVSTTPQYNSTTGMVTWTIHVIPATAGIVALAPQAIFQVAATPAVNQVGQSLMLLDKTAVQATDVFTNLALAASADAVTTAFPNDPIAKQVRDNTVQAH